MIQKTDATADTRTISRLHLGLRVADLERSVAFYRTLFGTEPELVRSDYAKFEVADPPLQLALFPGSAPAPGGSLHHAGIRVEEHGAFLATRDRLVTSGLADGPSAEVDCCYSRQEKLWVTDPDGNAWELYRLVESAAPEGADAGPHGGGCCTTASGPQTCHVESA